MQGDWAGVQDAWLEPGAKGERLRFQDFPAIHLMALASLAKAIISRSCLEPAGLSVPEWRLLTTLVGGGLVPFSQIASTTMMDKGQISRTLRTAQSKGLVETEIVPLERRADGGVSSIGRVMVRVTPRGEAVYRQVMPEAQKTQMRLLDVMSPEERRLVLELTRRIHDRLSADLRTL